MDWSGIESRYQSSPLLPLTLATENLGTQRGNLLREHLKDALRYGATKDGGNLTVSCKDVESLTLLNCWLSYLIRIKSFVPLRIPTVYSN